MLPDRNVNDDKKKDTSFNLLQGLNLKKNSITVYVDDIIHPGSENIIYYGLYTTNTYKIDVAIKNINPFCRKSTNNLFKEVDIIGKLSHPNIIKLYDVDSRHDFGIVMEYLDNGSLYRYLDEEMPLAWCVRYKIMTGIAAGLTHIHKNQLLHRNFNSKNILLDNQLCPKLSGFSSSIRLNDRGMHNSIVGELVWQAPELRDGYGYTFSADVYSLGMVFWEIGSCSKPFYKKNHDATLGKEITRGKREKIPAYWLPQLQSIIKSCWVSCPTKRNTAHEIYNKFIDIEKLSLTQNSYIRFNSKIQAYIYIISNLEKIAHTFKINFLKEEEKDINKKSVIENKFDECIKKLKNAVENHEQNIQIVSQTILDVLINLSELDDYSKYRLSKLKIELLTSDYEQTLHEKFENPHERYFLSKIFSELLLHPTQKMMIVISRLSNAIINVLLNLNKNYSKQIEDNFLNLLKHGEDVLCVKGFDVVPTLDSVIALLKRNSSTDVITILYIHYLYARYLCRGYPIQKVETSKPIGKFATIIKELTQEDNPTVFFNLIATTDRVGILCRSHIVDNLCTRSKLFTAHNGRRGREGDLEAEGYSTNNLGIMLTEQTCLPAYPLPSLPTFWWPDSKLQKPDLDSPYVLNLILNDAVYVSGPSSMTGIFLNSMELLGNFDTIELKQNYLLAVASYIIGGGFHSLPEVLSTAEYVLGLVPDYPVDIPKFNAPATPPLYSIFFKQQILIDSEFKQHYDNAWDALLQTFYVKDNQEFPSLQLLNNHAIHSIKQLVENVSLSADDYQLPLLGEINTLISIAKKENGCIEDYRTIIQYIRKKNTDTITPSQLPMDFFNECETMINQALFNLIYEKQIAAYNEKTNPRPLTSSNDEFSLTSPSIMRDNDHFRFSS